MSPEWSQVPNLIPIIGGTVFFVALIMGLLALLSGQGFGFIGLAVAIATGFFIVFSLAKTDVANANLLHETLHTKFGVEEVLPNEFPGLEDVGENEYLMKVGGETLACRIFVGDTPHTTEVKCVGETGEPFLLPAKNG